MNIGVIVAVSGLIILCIMINVFTEWLNRREYAKLREAMYVDLSEAVFLTQGECNDILKLIKHTADGDNYYNNIIQKLEMSIKYQEQNQEQSQEPSPAQKEKNNAI